MKKVLLDARDGNYFQTSTSLDGDTTTLSFECPFFKHWIPVDNRFSCITRCRIFTCNNDLPLGSNFPFLFKIKLCINTEIKSVNWSNMFLRAVGIFIIT